MTAVSSIRRYPVKAMGGEDLTAVDVDARGLVGDREFAVVEADGRLASGKDSDRFRRRDAVFHHAAATVGDGVLVRDHDGRTWAVGDPELATHLSQRLGAPVRVLAGTGAPHHDDGPVSLVGTATLRWCAEQWGVDADPRRLRVNLVVATDEPFVEESWLGGTLAVGSAGSVVLAVESRIERCRTVDVAQDETSAHGRLLKPLAAHRDMSLAVYVRAVRTGTVHVGDTVTVVHPAG